MKLATLRYMNGAWSRPFPDLDSERTMILVFAAPSFGVRHDLMIDLAAAYPRSAMIGCSTAGEIDQTRICDESITVAVVRFERTRVRQAEVRIASAADGHAAGARIAGVERVVTRAQGNVVYEPDDHPALAMYGEIAPQGSGKCDLHNQTMTLPVPGELS